MGCFNQSCWSWNRKHSGYCEMGAVADTCVGYMSDYNEYVKSQSYDCMDAVRYGMWEDKQKRKDKENTAMGNEFTRALKNSADGTLGQIRSKATSNLMNTKDLTTNITIGKASIVAIKTALKAVPKVPAEVKALLDSEYADIVIGSVIPIIISSVTVSPKAMKLSDAIVTANSVNIADKLKFVEDFIEELGVGLLPSETE